MVTRDYPAHFPPVPRREKPVIVFLTLCTTRTSGSLANPLVLSAFLMTGVQFQGWRIGQFVLMPDHLHLLCAPIRNYCGTLDAWVIAFKRGMTRMLNSKGYRIEWQRDFWDTQIRNGAHLHDRALYMDKNPIKKGLCCENGAWPYRGELFQIPGMLDFDL